MRTAFFTALMMPTLAAAQATTEVDNAAATQQFASILPLVLIFGIFYVMLIRPQQKRMKEHQAMLGELKKGDEVVTGGGIVGKVTKAEAGDTVTVEIAKGVEVSVLKSTISTVLGKTPVASVKPAKVTAEKKKNDNLSVNRGKIANDN